MMLGQAVHRLGPVGSDTENRALWTPLRHLIAYRSRQTDKPTKSMPSSKGLAGPQFLVTQRQPATEPETLRALLTNRGRKNSLSSAWISVPFSSKPLPERLQSLEISFGPCRRKFAGLVRLRTDRG